MLTPGGRPGCSAAIFSFTRVDDLDRAFSP